ncbi:hypothetical protein Pan258_12750 [Symmachiella dynata]|uniref:hypothetical protein n=1 Tax=Symmachiella dynata TaxID=2527995 RepID=UPI00118BDA85|nr:hypothetical protein [Symmachiella dynata]QDT47244.1 hypothetical protein Pan258_12750 [Symmachiella dynata]
MKLMPLCSIDQGDEEAPEVIAMSETEVDIRRRFADSYDYHFFATKTNTGQ